MTQLVTRSNNINNVPGHNQIKRRPLRGRRRRPFIPPIQSTPNKMKVHGQQQISDISFSPIRNNNGKEYDVVSPPAVNKMRLT